MITFGGMADLKLSPQAINLARTAHNNGNKVAHTIEKAIVTHVLLHEIEFALCRTQ